MSRHHPARPSSRLTPVALALIALLGAGCGGVNNPTDAKASYLGLDKAVGKAINLGLAGFNAASNANIPMQTGTGDVMGTLTVGGQVDAGASTNKTMNLWLLMSTYEDTIADPNFQNYKIVYNTDPNGSAANTAVLPLLSVKLMNIPNGTFSGSLTGDVYVDGKAGDLDGKVTLNLTLTGTIETDPTVVNCANPLGCIRRVAGGTHVTGTVTSQYGTYNVDLMI